jgi:hypothetical protein
MDVFDQELFAVGGPGDGWLTVGILN